MSLKFEPEIERIVELYKDKSNNKNIDDFLGFFDEDNKIGVYVDYGNVRPWADGKIKWHIDIKRLGQFF